MTVFGDRLDAAILVYEGFEGYGSVGSGIGTPTPNSYSMGLNRTLAYRSTGWQISSGLTFGPLKTSGNAVSFTTANQTYLSSQLDLDQNPGNSASFAGTLYSSYLVNITGQHNGGGVQLRVADVFDNTNGTRFFADADTRQGAPTTNAAVAYNSANVASTNRDLEFNTTYLVIGRYTNVGTPLSGANQGVGTLFVLTESQFTYLTSQSNWESYLDDSSRVIGNSANEIYARASTTGLSSGTFTFDDSDFVHFLAVASGSFDEFRYGDSLLSVLPLTVPEPRNLLWLGGIAMAMVRRRRSLPASE